MSNSVPKIRKIRKWPKARPASDLKWAVFNLETHFRLTEYTTRCGANLACRNILHDQPELKSKIGIKQKSYEVV